MTYLTTSFTTSTTPLHNAIEPVAENMSTKVYGKIGRVLKRTKWTHYLRRTGEERCGVTNNDDSTTSEKLSANKVWNLDQVHSTTLRQQDTL